MFNEIICKENQIEYYPEIVIIPADKGTAIVCKNEEYIRKEDELLRDIDVEGSNKTEKQLMQRENTKD